MVTARPHLNRLWTSLRSGAIHIAPQHILWVIIAAAAAIIISNSLVLTNYGKELAYLGVEHSTLLGPFALGAETERTFTIPQFQILANNGFQRFNETSPYREDLRNLYGFPLLDWFLPFKPQNFGFFVLPPSMGLSFHQTFLILAFFVGWTLVLRRLRLSPGIAFALATAFYFSSFLQFWWHAGLPALALLPWVMLSTTLRNPLLAGLATFYTGAAWLASNLSYMTAPFGLSAVVVSLLFLPREGRPLRIAILAAATAAACAIVYFYLHDAIATMLATSYPGKRATTGGTDTSFLMWWSQFAPTALIHDGRAVGRIEVQEAAGAGSFLFLALPFLVDWRHLLSPEQAALRRRLALPAALMCAMWIWVLIPLPSWAGAPLLFNLVPARRMVFGAGAIMLVVTAILIAGAQLRLTWPRVAAFSLAVALSWAGTIFFNHARAFSWSSILDLFPVVAAAAALIVARVFGQRQALGVLVAAAAAVNAAAFGTFYGVQSARPIFNPGEFAAKPGLDALAAAAPDGVLAIAGERLNGAILNGLGYQSIAHAFHIPAPDYLRRYYPDMPEERFNLLFNRFSLWRLVTQDEIEAPGLGVFLPVRDFPQPDIRRVEIGAPDDQQNAPLGGNFFAIVKEGEIRIEGWGHFADVVPQQAIYVDVDTPVKSARMAYAAGPYGGERMLSGFVIWLTLADGTTASSVSGAPIRLWTSDPELGWHRAEGPSTLP